MRTCCLWLGFIFANCVLLIQVKNGWNKGATMFVNGIPAINEPTLGVDYYPEQWDTNEMMKDLRSIREELGANTIRVGEFMWQMIEKTDGSFNFTFLDTVINNAEQAGLYVMLGTPTATFPAWILETVDDDDVIVLKGPDSPDGYEGAYAGFGGRRQYSFNSNKYLTYAQRITSQIANRYGDRDIVKFWQVDNEIGHENSDLDFSYNSLTAWRLWLSDKYKNQINTLNNDWGTVFWGTSYTSFDQVPLPLWTVPGSSARPNEVWRSNSNPGMLLDFRRFRRDSITSWTDLMINQLTSSSGGNGVKGEITTNAPGGFWDKALDHNDIFTNMDFAGYDNYPVWGGSTSAPIPSTVAIALDTVRGWKCNSIFKKKSSTNVMNHPNISVESDQCSWMVIEQLIGAQGHDIIGYTPRRGQAAAWSNAALLAHGANGLLFFRYRPALFGQEEFCYGVLDHSGARGNKWYEAKQLFHSARLHKDVIKTNIKAKICLLYDVENAYTWAAQPQSILFDFATENHRLYYPFWRNGASIDVLSLPHLLKRLNPSDIALAAAELFATYKVLLLPVAAVIGGGDEGEVAVTLLRAFLELGGSLWISFRSDLKDQRSQIRPKESRLAKLAGVKISEIESLNDVNAPANLIGADGAEYTASVFREGLEPIKKDDASIDTLYSYTDNFFGNEGYAAVTRRLFHPRESNLKGEVIYVGCGIEPEALVNIATQTITSQNSVHNSSTNQGVYRDVIPNTGVADSEWMEQVLRKDSSGNMWRVAINHDETAHTTSDGVTLKPYQVDVNRYRLP